MDFSTIIGGLFMLWIAVMLSIIPVLWIAGLVSSLVARLITPPHHIRYRDIRETSANISLKSEGYGVTTNWSSKAVASLMKARGNRQ
jgi:hypothetical protein